MKKKVIQYHAVMITWKTDEGFDRANFIKMFTYTDSYQEGSNTCLAVVDDLHALESTEEYIIRENRTHTVNPHGNYHFEKSFRTFGFEEIEHLITKGYFVMQNA